MRRGITLLLLLLPLALVPPAAADTCVGDEASLRACGEAGAQYAYVVATTEDASLWARQGGDWSGGCLDEADGRTCAFVTLYTVDGSGTCSGDWYAARDCLQVGLDGAQGEVTGETIDVVVPWSAAPSCVEVGVGSLCRYRVVPYGHVALPLDTGEQCLAEQCAHAASTPYVSINEGGLSTHAGLRETYLCAEAVLCPGALD